MPDNAFAEGGAGGMGMGDENCLIQINGGYTVLDAAGDGVDSNGSVEVTGGVLLVNGPTSSGDGAFDYDLTATVTGGTVLMVGSTGMAQNFTSGEQPFVFATASGSAGQSVAIVDADGTVVASMTAAKQFGMVLATQPRVLRGRHVLARHRRYRDRGERGRLRRRRRRQRRYGHRDHRIHHGVGRFRRPRARWRPHGSRPRRRRPARYAWRHVGLGS